ncbi:MAG: efflux RND transporter periplasmic adaptor subunit, partial [Bacteroidota bacterium]|nr:efflux RND transporter periplasmic adaptor subunit [Bacteroidota bacterium]
AESSAILIKLESDYKRAKELQEENIGTRKEYTAAKSSYYAERAKYKALKKQLSIMGLDAAKIETGTFYSSFSVKSPISGYISSIDAAVGQYVEPQQSIAEIIDNNSFQLKLSVFGKDLQKIEPGQKVEFYFNADKTQKYNATLNAIGKTIMSGSKSIECYAKIENPNNMNMVRNQFVEGDIFTSADTIWAVPETAILESESDFYILLFEKEDDAAYYLKKLKVNICRRCNNYVELTEQLSSKKLLQSGIYNIIIE